MAKKSNAGARRRTKIDSPKRWPELIHMLGPTAEERALVVEDLRSRHPLARVLDDALIQVARGKGQERHGNSLNDSSCEFLRQPWIEIARAHGDGFLTGQAEKKLREASRLEPAKHRAELLGAIVYTAMAVLYADLYGRGK